MVMEHYCRKCGAKLTDENGFPSRKTQHNYICKKCASKLSMDWYRANPKKYKASYDRANKKRRIRALEKIARVRRLERLICERCSCSDIRILTANHLHGAPKGFNRSGRNLWKIIQEMDDETVKREFSLLCHPCNWLYFYEQKFGLEWTITWKNQ